MILCDVMSYVEELCCEVDTCLMHVCFVRDLSCLVSLMFADFNDVSSDSGSGNSNDSTSKWVIGVVSGVCVSLLVGVGLVMYKRHQDSDLLLDDALPSCVADSGRGVSDYAIFSSTRGGDASYRPVEDSSSVESVLSEL